jgi:hypothetical protein
MDSFSRYLQDLGDRIDGDLGGTLPKRRRKPLLFRKSSRGKFGAQFGAHLG